jgi:hypothetical protein
VPTTNQRYDGPRSLAEVEDSKGFGKYARQFARAYGGPRHADEVTAVREGIDLAKHEIATELLNARVEASETEARKRHKDYDMLIDTHLIPLIKEDRRFFELLYHLPDPAEGGDILARLIANGGRMPSSTRRRLKLNKHAKDKPKKKINSLSHEEVQTLLQAALVTLSTCRETCHAGKLVLPRTARIAGLICFAS